LSGSSPKPSTFPIHPCPPGFDAVKINEGIRIAEATMTDRGWKSDICMIVPDDSGIAMLAAQLAKAAYDCVVIGGGLRLPPKSLPFFERVVNTVHQGAPQAAIAFNTRPEDTWEVAARWIGAD
jgi:hypothetical protein